MTKIDTITLSNIKCFESEHSTALPRITVVIGENNSGKTTLLSCFSALARLVANQNALEYNPFNITPFRMGSFENIARVEHTHFSLGGRANDIEFRFHFGKNSTEGIFEQKVEIQPNGSEKLTISRDDSVGKLNMSTPSFDVSLDLDHVLYSQISQWLAFAVRHGDLPYREDADRFHENGSSSVNIPPKIKLNKFLKDLSPKLPWSPIILEGVGPFLEPQRRRYGFQTALPMETWESEELSEMGKQLSLFDEIRIYRENATSYELEVGFNNQFFNISDVGLGIHAILPVLRAMRNGPQKTLLLQQPEAHLHPKAQAHLAELIAGSPHQFLIETHSEFIINRLSICVRKEILNCKDIGILWVEKIEHASKIHCLGFDEDGNLLDAPTKYRKFFNKETNDFLGIEQHVYANNH